MSSIVSLGKVKAEEIVSNYIAEDKKIKYMTADVRQHDEMKYLVRNLGRSKLPLDERGNIEIN